MDNDTKTSEEDFQSALLSELGVAPQADASNPPAPTSGDSKVEDPTPTAVSPAQVPPADESKKPVEGEPVKPEGDPTKSEEKTEEEKAAEAEAALVAKETQEETAARHEKEAAEKAASEEPKFATKDDVAAALREFNQETTGRVEQVAKARDEIISKLHPEGIDRNIYDSEGKVVKTAQDIIDRGLINERTNEPYTYEEAASFMLEAGRKMNENIEELNNWAGEVAEKNISLIEGNQRVMQKWGETLKTLPKEVVEQLASTYITKQLTFDKTESYITNMAMSPEEFYDTVMAPYSQLNASLQKQQESDEKAKQQAEAEKKKQEEDEQNERNGLPPQRGTSNVKANTGDPMLDALVDELAKP